jgi:predicted dehydrogenase
MLSSDETGTTQSLNWGSNMDLGLMRDFVDMVAAKRAPTITGMDGLRALEVALAAYRSAEQHGPVALPLA